MAHAAMQVLDTETLHCKAMRITGDLIPRGHLTNSNALDILLRPKPVFGCSFKGIKHVHIMVSCMVRMHIKELFNE
jgi:hypothetical protein